MGKKIVNREYLDGGRGEIIEYADGSSKLVIHDDFDLDDDIPEGCRACGNNYPYCKDSCPLFDD